VLLGVLFDSFQHTMPERHAMMRAGVRPVLAGVTIEA